MGIRTQDIAGGSGDVVGPASATDNLVATFSGTTGKQIKNTTTPALGTPASGTLSNCSGLPVSGVSGLGTGVATALGNAVSGSGSVVLTTSPVLTTPALGTPASGTLTNCTLPVSALSGLGTGVAAWLATPASSNLAAAVTSETGTGALVFGTNPVLTTPNIGTPSAGTLTNCTNLPVSTGVSGLGTGVATALGQAVSGTGNIALTSSPTFTSPTLGTPLSGTLTNCTGRVNASQRADQIATSGTAVTISSTAPTAGQVLTASSATAAAWASPVRGSIVARVYLNTAQSLGVGGYQKVPLDAVSYDPSGIWQSGTKEFRPNIAGYYQVNIRIGCTANGPFACAIGRNGSAAIAVGLEGANSKAVGGGALVQCNGTTDTIQAFVACVVSTPLSPSSNDTYMDIFGPLG